MADFECPCERDKNDDGICEVPCEEDGHSVRCVGDWSNSKHHYVGRYIAIFGKGMRKKFEELNYIDLFAGPGKCRIRGTREVRNGTPLIAAEHGFSKYFFADMNPRALDSLRHRFPDNDKATFYEDDCNNCAADIHGRIGRYSLNLLVADQTTVQLKFSTLRTLADGRRVDLIIYFPTMYFNRTIPVVKDRDKIQGINDFFGDSGEGFRMWKPRSGNAVMVAYYKERLRTLGYFFDGKVDKVIPILNEEKNAEMYQLLFASAHQRGYDFWKKIKAIDPHGQRSLPFTT
jgi:three-Cys-motif partner protein